jgi:hypothetical protein
MLKEIEEQSNVRNPYCLSGTEVQQRIEEMRQGMANIRMSIETLWINSSIKIEKLNKFEMTSFGNGKIIKNVIRIDTRVLTI